MSKKGKGAKKGKRGKNKKKGGRWEWTRGLGGLLSSPWAIGLNGGRWAVVYRQRGGRWRDRGVNGLVEERQRERQRDVMSEQWQANGDRKW